MNDNIRRISIGENALDTQSENLENIRQDIILASKILENDSFFQKNFGSKETLFYIALPSFQKNIKR